MQRTNPPLPAIAATPIILLLAASLASPGVAQTAGKACAADHYRYKITALPLHPVRINNSGVVAGTTEDHRVAVWTSNDGLRETELPAGLGNAEAASINASAQVAGFATRTGSSQTVAFRLSGKRVFLLSDRDSKAAAINDVGELAGRNGEHLVLWGRQKTQQIGDCCGGVVHGINNRGEVVGQINNREGRYRAFLWDAKRGLRSVAPPHSTMSAALAINLMGQVLVQTFTPDAVYLRENGKFTPVALAVEGVSQPLALNNCDAIVGEFGAASDFYHAFLWDRQHGFRDLNSLVDSGDWTLESAVDINDRGEIVGVGDHGNEQDVGFLLAPADEKSNRAKH